MDWCEDVVLVLELKTKEWSVGTMNRRVPRLSYEQLAKLHPNVEWILGMAQNHNDLPSSSHKACSFIHSFLVFLNHSVHDQIILQNCFDYMNYTFFKLSFLST